MGWVTFEATVDEAENLLKTEYHLHKHETGKPHVATDDYYIPEHIQPHVDFITPTVHFDSKLSMAKQRRDMVCFQPILPCRDLRLPRGWCFKTDR